MSKILYERFSGFTLTEQSNNEGNKIPVIEGLAVEYGKITRNRTQYNESTFENFTSISVPALANHNTDKIIGKATFSKAAEGIRFKMELNLNIEKAKEVFEHMKFGSISAVSIGSAVEKARYIKPENERYYIEIEKAELVELSAVAVPSSPNARISNVKESLSDFISEEELKEITDYVSHETIEEEEQDVSHETIEEEEQDVSHETIEEEKQDVSHETKKEGKQKMNDLKQVLTAIDDTKERIDTLKADESTLQNNFKEQKENWTTEKKAEHLELIKEKKQSIKTAEKNLATLEARAKRLEREEAALIEDMEMEELAYEESVDSETEAYLNNIIESSKITGMVEAITGSGNAMPVTLMNKIMDKIEKDTGSILSLTSMSYNTANMETLLIGSGDLTVSEGPYDGSHCATVSDLDVKKMAVKLGSYGVAIAITDAERNKTISAFEDWYVSKVAKTLMRNADYKIITAAKKDVDGDSIAYGFQGIASPDVIAKAKVQKIAAPEFTDKAMLDLLYSIDDASALVMNKKTFRLLRDWTDGQGNRIFEIKTEGQVRKIEGIPVVWNSQVKEFDASTENDPSVVIGNWSAYQSLFGKNSNMEMGATAKDKCRKNEVWAYMDVKGLPTEQEAFAILYKGSAT